MGRVGLGVAIVVAAVAAFSLSFGVSDGQATWLPVLACLAPLGVLWLARRQFQIVPLSPTWITCLVLSSVGVAGYILAPQLAGARGGGIVLALPVEDWRRTAFIYAAASASVALGALIVAIMRRSSGRVVPEAVVLSPRAREWMLWLAAGPVLVILLTLGGSLVSRDVYLAGADSKAVFGLAQQLATATVGLVGYVFAASKGRQRLVAAVLMAFYFGIFLALGSRRMALLPIVILIGVLMARPTRVWLKVLLAAVAAVVLLPIPLLLRGGSSHGLAAYSSELGQYSLNDVDWLTTINNILISFPTTGMSAFHARQLPLDYLWVGLNPLPGGIAGWYAIAPSLTLNAWTPFSSLGELWNYGPIWATAFWVIVGVVAANLDRSVDFLWRAKLPFASLAVVGLTALFALQALQYNVRSSSRLLLYAIAIAALASLIANRRSRASGGRDVNDLGPSLHSADGSLRPAYEPPLRTR